MTETNLTRWRCSGPKIVRHEAKRRHRTSIGFSKHDAHSALRRASESMPTTRQTMCASSCLKLYGWLCLGRIRFTTARRTQLDAMVAGLPPKVCVSVLHPDVILTMGRQGSLYRISPLGWGTGYPLYRTAARAFNDSFPRGLSLHVLGSLKQNRGKWRSGVMERNSFRRLRHITLPLFTLLHPRRVPEDSPLTATFLRSCEHIVPMTDASSITFQPRLREGMIRSTCCNKSRFRPPAHQRRCFPPPPKVRTRRPHNRSSIRPLCRPPAFQALRTKPECEWIPQLLELLDIDSESLAHIWDADFLYGPRDRSCEDT